MMCRDARERNLVLHVHDGIEEEKISLVGKHKRPNGGK
jgi:hypothetical protein